MTAAAPELLQTKLAIPSARADRVPRSRLIDQLNVSLECPLTVICAPAGFGKTSLITDWYKQSDRLGFPLAWLSLDEDDSDPIRFLTYLISALATISNTTLDDLLSSLRSPQPPPPKLIWTALISQIEKFPQPFTLILDDYHRVAATVHEPLAFLLDHMPAQMHLVITSREDPALPLSRLRARSQLAEIRADDLRFTREETALFLEQMLGIPLSADQIMELEARTEGWIAGLQLAVLAMQGRKDIDGFIAAFTGSHRFILDYLTDEVLSRQPEAIQSFLLQTSVLSRLSGSLCNALTDRTDGQFSLEQIEHGNLFLIALDSDRAWYRYHHLFGDMLRRHLQQANPDLVTQLHRRASMWYEKNGWVTEALEHALLSQDTEQAARLVQQTVEKIALAGQAQTILRWMNTLSEAVVRAHPRLCIYHAAVLMFTNQLDAAETWLQAAERSVHPDTESEEAKAILGWVALLRADIARVLGDLTSGVALAQRALALLPQTEALARAVSVMNVAHTYLSDGDVTSSAERTAEEAVASLRRIGNLFATMISITNLARLHTLQGRLRQAEITFRIAEHIAPGRGRVDELLNGAAFHIGLGNVLWERNELEAAQHHLVLGIDLVQGMLSVDADVVTRGYMALAKLRYAHGDLPGGLAVLDEFAKLARARQFYAPLLARGVAARVQFWLAQGNVAASSRWVTESGLNADDANLPYPREAEYLTLARFLIVQGKSEEALHLLERLHQDAESKARMGTVIEILGLRALAWQVHGDLEQAMAELTRALKLAEPDGYVRIFVDRGVQMAALLREAQARRTAPVYVAKLLAAFESIAPQKPALSEQEWVGETIEPLSERELEVLRLLVDGGSNREIAAQLVVSLGTVKKHVSNIFVKLDARSRTQVITIAREQHLL